MSSLEDVHKLASDKGMAVVDEQQTTDDLESRFHDVLIEADELSLKQDPETEPYKSKYAANRMMEEMHKMMTEPTFRWFQPTFFERIRR